MQDMDCVFFWSNPLESVCSKFSKSRYSANISFHTERIYSKTIKSADTVMLLSYLKTGELPKKSFRLFQLIWGRTILTSIFFFSSWYTGLIFLCQITVELSDKRVILRVHPISPCRLRTRPLRVIYIKLHNSECISHTGFPPLQIVVCQSKLQSSP